MIFFGDVSIVTNTKLEFDCICKLNSPSVRIAEGNNLRETVSVTIPVNDRNLLK